MFLANAQHFSYWQNLIKSPCLLLDIQNFKTGHPTPTPFFLLTKATCVFLIFNPPQKKQRFLWETFWGMKKKAFSDNGGSHVGPLPIPVSSCFPFEWPYPPVIKCGWLGNLDLVQWFSHENHLKSSKIMKTILFTSDFSRILQYPLVN